MTHKAPLVLFGTGEIATLARYYFDQDSSFKPVAFTCDDEFVDREHLDGLPVVPFSVIHDRFPPNDFYMHVALSYSKLNKTREAKYQLAKQTGYRLASYVCSKSTRWPDLQIGDNCFVLEDQTLQPTVKLGSNVMLWSGNHIGHGTIVGDHTYFASHVVVSGHCRIGKRCFFGVNATIRDFTVIGDDCFVGMDASVTTDLASNSVVLGAKSTVLPRDDRRAASVLRSFFKL